MAFAEAERIAAAALAPLSDPEASSATRSKTALAILDAVDPPLKAELELSTPLDAEGISSLGLAQLRALASQVQS